MATIGHTSTPAPATASDTTGLWRAAAVTAVSSVLFPRLNAVFHQDQAIWELDAEAVVLAPLVVIVAVALFALPGRRIWRGAYPARGSAVIGALAILGLVFFWLSAGIILGGLAVALGVEALRRHGQRRALAWTGVVLGSLAAAVNAGAWLVGM